MPLNDSNFLLWYDQAENPLSPGFPRPYVREPEILSPVVWLLPGETYWFYLNASNNSAPAGVLQLVDERGNLSNPVQTLSTISFPGGSHLLGQFTVPAGQAEGFARLKLGTYQTQYLWVTTAAKAPGATVLLKFRNAARLMSFRYSYVPADFYQQLRVRMAMKTEEPEVNKTTYREATTGKTRPLYSEPRQLVTFQTPEYDRLSHRAVTALLEHDELYINSMPYAFAGAYKANSNEGDLLTTGEFSVSDETYASLHRA